MNDEAQYYIPRYLDEPARWLFWPMDEAIALVAPAVVSLVLFNHIVMGFVVGVMFMIGLKKLKSFEGNQVLLAMAYWYLPLGKRMLKFTPPSYVREYLG